MSGLGEELTDLSPQKRALLKLLLKDRKGPKGKLEIKALERTGQVQHFQLSYAQKRLWFLHQLEPDTWAYNMPFLLPITDIDIDVVALEAAMHALAQRHESLRTSFAMCDGQSLQVVHPHVVVACEVIDLSPLSGESQQVTVERVVKEAVQQPFDLATAPLMRAILLRFGVREQILIINLHHIIADTWSINVIARELSQLYSACVGGQPAHPHLPAVSLQYADYAVWQHAWLDNEAHDQRRYWETQLAGQSGILNLPTDHIRPPIQTFNGATHRISIDASWALTMRDLGRQAGATPFMTLLAVFVIVLHRYTNQEDILIGTPVAGRNRAEIESIVGIFVNTLVLRCTVQGNPFFNDLLEQVRDITLDALANQDFPFEKLVETLITERDLSRNPFFQVMFALTHNSEEQWSQSLIGQSNSAKFDLSLDAIICSDGHIDLVFEYNVDLFDALTVVHIADHFYYLVQEIASNPKKRIGAYDVFPPQEQNYVQHFAPMRVDIETSTGIHHLIEEQARERPDAVAVVYPLNESGDRCETITYGLLNSRAAQLASRIQRSGIGLEMRVGICMHRSIDIVIAQLAVLKAGAAYVPIDPSYPADRLAFMIADSGSVLLLTHESLRPSLECYGVPCFTLDADLCQGTSIKECIISSAVSVDAQAYVIYTSGSTGQPKGVVVTHGSILNAYWAWQKAYSLTSERRHLQMANVSCDVCTGDFVRALCSGGQLILCPRDALLMPDILYQLLHNLRITHAEFVPAVLRPLIAYAEKTGQGFEFFKVLIAGSETWSFVDYKRLSRLCGPHTRLINSYGVTEATVDSAYFERADQEIVECDNVPIGQPYLNTQLYVVDTLLRVTPVGVPGELYIGGAGVARGYVNRPGLTASLFVPNPFDNRHGSILYRTGDVVRYSPDGYIEFMGRVDRQVKIRGHRVDTREIEAVINEHSVICESLVVMSGDDVDGRHLIAYIVRDETAVIQTQQVRDFLKSRLPRYMIPAAIIALEAFPLTSNGKVDYTSLPTPKETDVVISAGARTSTESALLDIWERLLGHHHVGIFESFFDVGGHSLLLPQLLVQIQALFHVDLPLRTLFESPTIAELARTIDAMHKSEVTAVSMDDVDLLADVVLNETIRASLTYCAATTRTSALLTGASGFLGIHLLVQLLQDTNDRVYCLVRASNSAEAVRRIEATLASYGLTRYYDAQRVTVFVGDLTKPALGLSSGDFTHLAQEVGCIYHCGATVNVTYPYSALKAANVDGTQEILRLATTTTIKPVHFVSTLNVFSAPRSSDESWILEDDLLDNWRDLVDGYSQTKWVAERIVMIARDVGVPVTIFRPGLIGGHSQIGIVPQTNLIWALVKGCIQLGYAPDIDLDIDLAPVDYVSAAIVAISRQARATGKAFHLHNPHPYTWHHLVASLHNLGYDLQWQPFDEWYRHLYDSVTHSPENALTPLLPIFSNGGMAKTDLPANPIHYSCHNTRQFLTATSISCRPFNDEMLQHTIDYLIKSDHIS